MKYWDEMTNKYGFGDGGSEPVEARMCREIYLKAVNALAEKEGSKFRFVAYDRPGMHNGCMILSVGVDTFNAISDRVKYKTGDLEKVALSNAGGMDEALTNAITDACMLDLDQYVKVRTSFDRIGFGEAMKNIRIG